MNEKLNHTAENKHAASAQNENCTYTKDDYRNLIINFHTLLTKGLLEKDVHLKGCTYEVYEDENGARIAANAFVDGSNQELIQKLQSSMTSFMIKDIKCPVSLKKDKEQSECSKEENA